MNIAVIEDNRDYRELLKEVFVDCLWHVDFFVDPSEFGKANLQIFDVILVDVMLPTINGRDLIKSVAKKTSAELFLMSASFNNFLDDDITNERITGLIDKLNVNSIIDHLKYIDAKLRINKAIQTENEKLNDVVYNGYKFETKGNIAVLGTKDTLRKETRRNIELKITSRKIKKCIMYFYDKDVIRSAMLGDLTYFYKFFKNQNGILVFWDNSSEDILKRQLEAVNLDKLIKVMNSLDEAINFLKVLP